MTINPVTVTFSRHELEAIQHVIEKHCAKNIDATLDFAADKISAALKKVDTIKERQDWWAKHQDLNFREVQLLFDGIRYPFHPGEKTPYRRGDIMHTQHDGLPMTFAYVNDNGDIYTQEADELPKCRKSTPFKALVMLGKEDLDAQA